NIISTHTLRPRISVLFTYTTLFRSLLRDLFEGDDPFTDQEAIGLCFFFVLAGVDSVTNALSLMFAKLASRPALRRKLAEDPSAIDRKSTRLNSSHVKISYAVFCLKN